ERQRDEYAGEAVDLAAGEQAEDDQERVEPQRASHDVRNHDVALDLMDDEEEDDHPDDGDRVHDERIDHRGNRAEPGAEIRDQLGHAGPDPEQERVTVGARQEPGRPQDPHADSHARADDQRHEQLALDVAGHGVAHAGHQRTGLGGGEAAGDNPPQPRQP